MCTTVEPQVRNVPSSNNTKSVTESAMQARQNVQRLLEAARDGPLDEFKLAELSFMPDELASIKEGHGRNALHLAALGGQSDICKYLITERHLDVNDFDEQGSTPLKQALARNNASAVKELLELGADACLAKENDPTPIFYAASSGSTDILRAVLGHGAKANEVSPLGTPLIWAASSESTEAAKLLLEHGADATGQDKDGITALLLAAANGHAAPGNVPLARMLLDAGAAVDAKAQGAVTPLHVAAETGCIELVSMLLKAGADPNAEDQVGARPIDAAASMQERGVVELLLPLTAPAASGEWTVDWLLEHAEAPPSMKEDQCGCGHAHEPGAHGHGPHVDEAPIEVPEAEEPNADAAAVAKRRGDEAFVAADFHAAVAAYTCALRHDTSSHAVWANRSAAGLRTGDHESALTDARIARTVNPAYTKAWYREGCAARELGLWNDAAQAFFRGYQTDPNNHELAGAFQAAVQQGKQAHAAAHAAHAHAH